MDYQPYKMIDTIVPGTATTRRIARAITEIFAPANLAAALLLGIAWHAAPSGRSAVLWGLGAALFAAVLPLVYLIVAMRRGQVTDLHVRKREQRPGPMLLILCSVGFGTFLLALAGAPRELVALIAAMAIGVGSATLVTLWWKISVHVAVVAGTVTILLLVFGWATIPAVVLIPLVAWSRIALGDHTRWQTICGAALGFIVAGTIFPLLR
jgi:hypothetical protein